MADWKKLLMDVLLADGVIDAAETRLIEKEILADGVVDNREMAFLIDLRNASTTPSAPFETFFFRALKANILADGVVDPAETRRLRKILFADGKIDANEKRFLKQLKKEARGTCPEFEKLYGECVG